MTRARKAVIPAAGLGTRFLPATKAQPKEMLTVVDTPAIQYVVEEAVEAGLADVLLVTSAGKSAMEDHFDRSIELEQALEDKGKKELLALVRRITDLAEVTSVRQGEPLGLGHAIGRAATFVGDEPFAVLLPDDLLGRGDHTLGRMVDLCAETGRSVVAVKRFPREEISAYGVVAGEPVEGRDGVLTVTGLVEKPEPADAPSEYAIVSRYVLTPDVFDKIAQTAPGAGGEIQITDAIQAQASEEPIYAVVHTGDRYDIGAKADYLRATVELAASHPELGGAFRSFLRDFVATLRD